jgi:hypothetical protein
MEEYKCAFSNTLVTHQFGCELGMQVARRGGPDIACLSEAAHRRCADLFERMKQAALPAFGVEDNLLSMPHSVLVKVQYGGLLGLQRLLENEADGSAEVTNIHDLVGRAFENYGGLEAIPCQAFVGAMTSYKLKRRR